MTPKELRELYKYYVQIMDEYELRHADLSAMQQEAVLQGLKDLALQIKHDVALVPQGMKGSRYIAHISQSIDVRMSEYWDGQYPRQLSTAIADGAREVAEREAEIQRLIGRPGAFTEHVVAEAVQRVYDEEHGTGERLLSRVAKNSVRTRSELIAEVQERIRRGESRAAVDHAITNALTAAGEDNVRYRASRIVRTEFANASREAHKIAVLSPDGNLRPGVLGIGWRLSPAHPRPDICDVWATDDLYDLGKGNYPPDQLPLGHPNCLCLTVTVLDLPGAPEMVWVEAQPGRVPEGQKRYYERVKISTNTRKSRRKLKRRF